MYGAVQKIFRNSEKLLLAVFCFVFPFGTRIAVWHAGDGKFFPYDTIFLYVSDTIVVLLVFCWLRMLWQRRKSHHPVHIPGSERLALLSLGVFLLMGCFSALQSPLPTLGMLVLLRLLAYTIFTFLLAWRLREMRLSNFCVPLFFSGVFQAVLAWYQFLAQKSAGLGVFGEQVLGVKFAGVAKIDVLGEKIVRAYGTFPHPNILAAFLLFVIFVSVWRFFLSENIAYSHTPVYESKYMFVKNLFWLAGIAVMLAALLFTFSRSGWIAIASGACLYGGWLIFRKNRMEPEALHRLVALGIVGTSVLLFAGLYFPDTVRYRTTVLALADQAVQMRLSGVFWAARMVQDHRFFGVGPGQFVQHIEPYAGILPESWMYQPAHNVYLLIAAEFGLLGLIAYIFFIGFIMRAWWLNRGGYIIPFATFSSFLLLGFFDHYFFTFPQGIMVWWLAVALMLSRNTNQRMHANLRNLTPPHLASPYQEEGCEGSFRCIRIDSLIRIGAYAFH